MLNSSNIEQLSSMVEFVVHGVLENKAIRPILVSVGFCLSRIIVVLQDCETAFTTAQRCLLKENLFPLTFTPAFSYKFLDKYGCVAIVAVLVARC